MAAFCRVKFALVDNFCKRSADSGSKAQISPRPSSFVRTGEVTVRTTGVGLDLDDYESKKEGFMAPGTLTSVSVNVR